MSKYDLMVLDDLVANEAIDRRAVHVKIGPTVAGRTHFVTVCEPDAQVRDETAWRFPKQRHYPDSPPDSNPTQLVDYVMAQADALD